MKKFKLSKLVAVFSAICIIALAGTLVTNAAIDDSSLGISSELEATDAPVSLSAASASLPSKYSSADLGYVTSIKNQGSNDCWAYSGIATFESKLLREGYNTGVMSSVWANVWATTRLNGTGWQRNYNSDGYSDIIPGYLTSWYGGILESDIDSIDTSGDIYGDLAPYGLAKYGTLSIRYLSKSEPDQIKQSIMDDGGVCTAYANSVSCLKNNVSYYMPDSYTGSYIGHAVEIVGWDDNYSKDNFGAYNDLKPESNGAWLARNSWGNYNSLGGYFWISYEDKYVFSQYYGSSYTIQEVMEITDDVMLKQNEIYGATYEFAYVITNDITYINRFDFSDNYNIIDKVVFETECVGADYDIYYVPVKDELPDNDENNWVKLDSGTVDFSGYICADFDDFTVPDDEGAIAVNIDTSKLNQGKTYDSDLSYVVNSLGVGEWKRTTAGVYTFINDSSYGDSFIKYGGKMWDLLDWYKDTLDDDLGGTFVIKAVTLKNTENAYLLGDVNLDGNVTIDDATLVQKYLAGLESLSEQAYENANVDNSSNVDIDDVTAIQKYIAGIYEW